jgi:hypothetical protein
MTGNPECVVCFAPVVASQTNARNLPCHLACQSQLDPAERNPNLPGFFTAARDPKYRRKATP